MPARFTPAMISAAIEGFEAQKESIHSQIAELRAMLPSATKTTPPAKTSAVTGISHKRSDEVRQRMAEAQRQRWAKLIGESKPSAMPAIPAKKTRKKFSAATRQRMKAAQQLRWAKIRGEVAPVSATISCPDCGASFKNQSGLINHIRYKHRDRKSAKAMVNTRAKALRKSRPRDAQSGMPG